MKNFFLPVFVYCSGFLFLLSGCADEKNNTTPSTIASAGPSTAPDPAVSITPTSTQILNATSSASTASTTSTALSTTTTEPEENISTYRVKASVTLSKPAYKSGERMDIIVRIDSSDRIDPAVVRLYGIYADYYRMNKSEKFKVSKGQNSFKFTYTTPPCTICSGIRPGNYVITAEVSYNGTVLAGANRNVVLEQ